MKGFCFTWNILILIVLLAGCTISADGKKRFGQGELLVDSSVLKLRAQTARPLPEITVQPDGSYHVKPSTKLEELEMIFSILTLP